MIAIVGAGIAGTTLAWQFHFSGVPVLLFDRDDRWTASKAAAGLITPVTGLRLAKSWRFEQLWPIAQKFYQRVEQIINDKILHEHPAIRLFQREEEKKLCEQKSHPDLIADHAITAFVHKAENVSENWIQPFGAVAFQPAGQLDVRTYLKLSHRFFNVIHCDINPESDVETSPQIDIKVRIQGQACDAVVFCQGFAGANNCWFPDLVFNATKGEVLSIELDGISEYRTVHASGWISKMQTGKNQSDSNLYAAGSTYERDPFTLQPTDLGRAEIERKLKLMTKQSYRVVDHLVGVRPIIKESQPSLVVSRKDPRIFCLNGLGSKGSLVSPWAASELLQVICGSARRKHNLH
jgi:glycine oxidase